MVLLFVCWWDNRLKRILFTLNYPSSLRDHISILRMNYGLYRIYLITYQWKTLIISALNSLSERRCIWRISTRVENDQFRAIPQYCMTCNILSVTPMSSRYYYQNPWSYSHGYFTIKRIAIDVSWGFWEVNYEAELSRSVRDTERHVSRGERRVANEAPFV